MLRKFLWNFSQNNDICCDFAQKYWNLGENTELKGICYWSKVVHIGSPVFMLPLVIIMKKVCVYGVIYGNPTY